jgi:hypothetical protein
MTIEIRTAPLELELRDDGDGRTLHGVLVPYGREVRVGSYVESFAFGAFTDTDPSAVPLLALHDHESLPIGRAMSLQETPAGLEGALRVSETRAGDEVLTLIRDRAVSGLSIGFTPIQDRWNATRSKVERLKASLREVSVTPFPVYPDARIAAVRSEELLRTPRLTVARYRF